MDYEKEYWNVINILKRIIKPLERFNYEDLVFDIFREARDAIEKSEKKT